MRGNKIIKLVTQKYYIMELTMVTNLSIAKLLKIQHLQTIILWFICKMFT